MFELPSGSGYGTMAGCFDALMNLRVQLKANDLLIS
jgi:hypothetical protein